MGEAGDPAGAAAAFDELLTDYLRLLGSDHPDTLTARHHLAHCGARPAILQVRQWRWSSC